MNEEQKNDYDKLKRSIDENCFNLMCIDDYDEEVYQLLQKAVNRIEDLLDEEEK